MYIESIWQNKPFEDETSVSWKLWLCIFFPDTSSIFFQIRSVINKTSKGTLKPSRGAEWSLYQTWSHKYPLCDVRLMQTDKDVHLCTSQHSPGKVNVTPDPHCDLKWPVWVLWLAWNRHTQADRQTNRQTDRRIICLQPRTACPIMSGMLKRWALALC